MPSRAAELPEAERSEEQTTAGATAEMVRLLGYLLEAPRDSHAALWELLDVPDPPHPADHTDLFVLQLVPHASIYLGSKGMIGGAARDEIAGLWRAVGRVPPPDADHLGRLLGLVAELWEPTDDPAQDVIHRHAADAIVSQAIATWLGPWLVRVEDLGHPAFRVWADLVRATVLDASVPATRVSVPPAEDVVGHVISPARSGLFLTRSDLSRCAADLGLGLRIGERAYTLRALLDQDRPGVLAWLSSDAADWSDRIAHHTSWSERARRTAGMLAR